MKKELVIQYLWNKYKGNMTMQDAFTLLSTYCKENGKEDDSLIELFIILVSASGIIFNLVDEVLKKYKRQHGIIEVYKPTSLNGRNIILIY